jgi:hypothetical protein
MQYLVQRPYSQIEGDCVCMCDIYNNVMMCLWFVTMIDVNILMW